MVVVDHNKNIQRIIDVIKDDTTLFDSGSTEGKLIDVIFGNPNTDNKMAISEKPAVYVTTKPNTQLTRYPFGVNNSGNVNQTTVQYEVVLLAESREDTEQSQKQLYSLMTNLRNLFDNNPKFTIPPSQPNPGTDPIFSRSIINEVPWDTATRGQLVTSVTYIITATIGVELTITIPGFGELDIISDSGDDGRNNIGVKNDEGYTKRSKGEFAGTRYFEYEYDTTTFDSLEAIIDAGDPLDLTLKYPSGDKTYPSKLEYQRHSKRFDGIRTVFLQVNRETV